MLWVIIVANMGIAAFWIIVILGFIFFTNSFSGGSSDLNYVPTEDNITIEDVESDTSTFGGYDCTEDCSGHDAGYEWASDNDISSTDDCGGNSDSFIEGCMSYVEENYPEDNYEEEDSGY
jgi:hypothetical protein